MARTGIERAPRWRSALAGLVDAGIGFALLRAAPTRGRQQMVVQALWPSGVIVRQQLGSPGQRLLVIRTVDERTGLRVAAWRSVASVALVAGAGLLTARLRPQESDEQRHARERFDDELADTYRRHPGDPPAGEAERARLRGNAPPDMIGRLGGYLARTVAVTVIVSRLRRRLVRPVDVRA